MDGPNEIACRFQRGTHKPAIGVIRHTFRRLRVENEMRQGNSALGLTDRVKVFGWMEGRLGDVLLHFSTRCMLVPRPKLIGVGLAGMGLHVLT